MKTQARDLLVLLGEARRAAEALEGISFVPPMSVQTLPDLPDPSEVDVEPLLYLVGTLPGGASADLADWMDRVRAADGAPVAFLLPRDGLDWYGATAHPHFCGLLPTEPEIPVEALEQLLHSARQNTARRWGQGALRQARLAWTFTTLEAADPEQAWQLLEATLAEVVGFSSDLSFLGMAFAEALTNAVEHGSLELDSSLKDATDDGLLRFFREREDRLRNPRLRKRRIWVRAEVRGERVRVRIRHEGRGFRPGRRKPAHAHPGAHGYGMSMIRGLVDEARISSDGRCVTLTHHLPRVRFRSHGVAPTLFAGPSPDRRAA